MAMRAKTPIFDDDGKIIGVVSIGYLISKIDSWRSDFYSQWQGCLSCCCWYLCCSPRLFAAHIRRQMLGMEPKQIARVVRQQEALFSSVYEGLIAVDPDGYITAINRSARKMLGLSSLDESGLENRLVRWFSRLTFHPADCGKTTGRDGEL